MDERKIGYCLNSFMINKIDESVSCSVIDQKLTKIGLTYGGIQSYQQYFPNNNEIGLVKSSQSYSGTLETLQGLPYAFEAQSRKVILSQPYVW